MSALFLLMYIVAPIMVLMLSVNVIYSVYQDHLFRRRIIASTTMFRRMRKVSNWTWGITSWVFVIVLILIFTMPDTANALGDQLFVWLAKLKTT